jgi:transposase
VARVAELERKLEALEEGLEALRKKTVALERENKILRAENVLLKRDMYGCRSERLDPGQLDFFRTDAPAVAGEASTSVAVPQEKEQSGHGRALFSPSTPRDVIEIDVPTAERICGCCGKPMKCIGEELTERGHSIPAKIIVRRYVRQKYACADGHEVKTAALPDGVIDGGKYEASVYANIVTSKYADHLPLHRLEGIYKRSGVHLPKQTMWDMLVRVDEIVAQPVLKQMHAELLEEPVLHADETPVTMRLDDSKGTKKGYAWGWRNLHSADRPSKAIVEFRTSRSRDGPSRFLGDWSGTLIADGYTGYDEVIRTNRIRRAGCWAHARRKLKEALDTGSEGAAGVLALVQRLFEVERPINELVQAGTIDRPKQLELRRGARAEHSAAVVEAIYVEVERLWGQRSTLPKSKLGKALGYLTSQRQPLAVFLEDARVPIHNNDSERDLRHLAVGRKNWLVFGSQRGGEVACRLYSLVLSCKQCGANPETYLEDVLMKVATTPASQIATLTPWAWAAAQRAEPDAAS